MYRALLPSLPDPSGESLPGEWGSRPPAVACGGGGLARPLGTHPHLDVSRLY